MFSVSEEEQQKLKGHEDSLSRWPFSHQAGDLEEPKATKHHDVGLLPYRTVRKLISVISVTPPIELSLAISAN